MEGKELEDYCKKHPTPFVYKYLGIKPYKYQNSILRRYRDLPATYGWDKRVKSERMIVCKPRQIGISYCVAFLAIWYAFMDKAHSGVHNDTKVIIISRSDRQAVKLMALIQKLCFHKEIVNSEIEKGRGSPLSKTEMHFKNGSWIKCYPPTDAARGETADLLICDEAAFIDRDIFKDALEPTVSAVGGKIILVSTPKGQSGLFFELFDPHDIYPEHEYERFWFHWKYCENELQKKLIEQKYKSAKLTGNLKNFDQEYGALFTVDEEAFFEDGDVERGLDKELCTEYERKDLPCSIGIDYGMTRSATVISVITHSNNKLRLIFQFAEIDFDLNRLTDGEWEHSIQKLMKRYNVHHVVVDDCPQGDQTNKKLEDLGYPVMRFDFKSDRYLGEKNRGLYIFRSNLKQNRIKYPDIRALMGEMKSMQEIRMPGSNYMKIKAPQGYNDDRVMSLMMACYPFLNDDNNFSSVLVDYEKVQERIDKDKKKNEDGRFDQQWDDINSTEGEYGFLFDKRPGRPGKEEEND